MIKQLTILNINFFFFLNLLVVDKTRLQLLFFFWRLIEFNSLKELKYEDHSTYITHQALFQVFPFHNVILSIVLISWTCDFSCIRFAIIRGTSFKLFLLPLVRIELKINYLGRIMFRSFHLPALSN